MKFQHAVLLLLSLISTALALPPPVKREDAQTETIQTPDMPEAKKPAMPAFGNTGDLISPNFKSLCLKRKLKYEEDPDAAALCISWRTFQAVKFGLCSTEEQANGRAVRHCDMNWGT